jgi:hypothetical protein
MKNILRFIFILLPAALLCLNSFAQEDTASVKVKQTEWTRGIRLGCDVSRFVLPYTQKGRKAVEFSIDTEWKPRLFLTGEAGFENVSLSNDYINYTSNGFYVRAGYDKNVMKHDAPQYHDMFFIGLRYGMSLMEQQVNSYTITDSIWGNVDGSYSSKMIHTHWLEFVSGIKAEITKSIYIGFSARVRLRLFSTKDVTYGYANPGFGNGSNRLNVGFNYSIYYQIPIMKVRSNANGKK